MKLAATVLVSFLSATTMFSQAAPAKPAVHHAAGPAGAATGVNAPGIPKVTGLPKTLYSLKYVDLVVGTGEPATPRKWYTVNYTGWLTTGKKFDSSYDHTPPGPITFPYGARRVIAGWDTGFEGMRVGGKRRLLIPYQLAYGEAGNPSIPPKSTLIFDIELVSISEKPPAPAAPPAGAAPPTGEKAPAAEKAPTPPPAGAAPAGTAPAGTAPATTVPGTTAPAATPATPSAPSGTAPNPAVQQAKPNNPAPSNP